MALSIEKLVINSKHLQEDFADFFLRMTEKYCKESLSYLTEFKQHDGSEDIFFHQMILEYTQAMNESFNIYLALEGKSKEEIKDV